jgi:outer membrane protein assembly factor BamB
MPTTQNRETTDNQDNVYFCADTKRCYGLDKNGSKLWEYSLSEGGGRISPVIADDGTMYLAGGDMVFALIEASQYQYLPLVQRQE